MSKKKTVVAIGLDAADPSAVEQWISEGKLKNLRKLRDRGVFADLDNFEYPSAEGPWTTFLTGCSPQKTGFWQYYDFLEKSYGIHSFGAYDFKEFPPFYAVGDSHKVAIFDMPQTRFSDKVNGIDIHAWGSHAPMHESASQPAELYQDITEKHGPHPLLHDDYLEALRSPDQLERFKDLLQVGIERRTAICKDLLKQEDWDLFLTIFSETHSAGHGFWHFKYPDHPLYDHIKNRVAGDPLYEVFQKVDEAVGEIIDNCPEDADIVVFSVHSMGSNSMDLPSIVFLPEFLYRYSFPGQAALTNNTSKSPLKSPFLRSKDWVLDIWRTVNDPNPIRRFLRRRCPYRLIKHVDSLLGVPSNPNLVPPYELRRMDDAGEIDAVPYQPASWFTFLWPDMKAFALPSFSEGYIRINLKGREAKGKVDASEYDSVCEELTGKLMKLTDPRSGAKLVKEVVRTRQDPYTQDQKLPNADLIVVWNKECSTDVVDSAEYGRIGPFHHYRGGSHRPNGFMLAAGPNIPKESDKLEGHVMDMAPTILNLMDAEVPEYLEGESLLKAPSATLA